VASKGKLLIRVAKIYSNGRMDTKDKQIQFVNKDVAYGCLLEPTGLNAGMFVNLPCNAPTVHFGLLTTKYV
jgi:hypothetical protein